MSGQVPGPCRRRQAGAAALGYRWAPASWLLQRACPPRLQAPAKSRMSALCVQLGGANSKEQQPRTCLESLLWWRMSKSSLEWPAAHRGLGELSALQVSGCEHPAPHTHWPTSSAQVRSAARCWCIRPERLHQSCRTTRRRCVTPPRPCQATSILYCRPQPLA